MTKVGNYYSSASTDPDVYHNHDDCPSGQNILPQNRLMLRDRRVSALRPVPKAGLRATPPPAPDHRWEATVAMRARVTEPERA